MNEDTFGNEILLGDLIAYVNCLSGGSVRIKRATVVDITDKYIRALSLDNKVKPFVILSQPKHIIVLQRGD